MAGGGRGAAPAGRGAPLQAIDNGAAALLRHSPGSYHLAAPSEHPARLSRYAVATHLEQASALFGEPSEQLPNWSRAHCRAHTAAAAHRPPCRLPPAAPPHLILPQLAFPRLLPTGRMRRVRCRMMRSWSGGRRSLTTWMQPSARFRSGARAACGAACARRPAMPTPHAVWGRQPHCQLSSPPAETPATATAAALTSCTPRRWPPALPHTSTTSISRAAAST